MRYKLPYLASVTNCFVSSWRSFALPPVLLFLLSQGRGRSDEDEMIASTSLKNKTIHKQPASEEA